FGRAAPAKPAQPPERHRKRCLGHDREGGSGMSGAEERLRNAQHLRDRAAARPARAQTRAARADERPRRGDRDPDGAVRDREGGRGAAAAGQTGGGIMNTPEELRELVESYLSELALTPELGGLEASMRYALEGGGKRVRPVLCLATAEAAGAEPESALPAAAALELVHSFSLVHDDLPALDDDDVRRGQPST